MHRGDTGGFSTQELKTHLSVPFAEDIDSVRVILLRLEMTLTGEGSLVE